MRKLHQSYEVFVKEQKPKYGKTFLEWFSENNKIGDVDLLSELQKKNKCFVESGFVGFLDEFHISYFRDFFTKKLQLCHNLVGAIINEGKFRYELGVVADIMDLYEDVIQEICIRENVYVCYFPSGLHSNINRPFTTGTFVFKNLNELKDELETGNVIVYFFRILENGYISMQYSKREPLTRTVLFEGTNH